MAKTKAPEGERGAAVTVPLIPGTPGWGSFIQEGERVPEWLWPGYIATCEDMLNDGQVWSLFMGTILPLLEYDWWIDANGADAGYTDALAADLGLPVADAAGPAERGGQILPGLYRFNFTEHLWEALLAFAYGHYYFEQVAEYDDGDGIAHLRKLAPRPPSTIGEILTDQRGGLRAIRQHGIVVTNPRGKLLGMEVPEVRVDRLVAYVWLPDGKRRWIGTPMLRKVYQGFLVNDRLARVDAINHERAGGVPGFETDESYAGADLGQLRELASQFRVGEESGWASPAGAKMVIAKGFRTDVVGSMRYHDEKMSRAWGRMLQQLGQTTTGSRALGETFGDVEALIRRAIGKWFAGTFREHVIEDWFGWNVPGFAEPAPGSARLPHPLLRFRPPAIEGSDEPASGGPPDPEPFRDGPAARARWGCGGGGWNNPRNNRRPEIRAGASLPARPLRRQPYPHEVRAAVDFESLDLIYDRALDSVEGLWEGEWLPQARMALKAAILFTKAGTERKRVTRADMARITAPVPDPAALIDVLINAATVGAMTAVDELLAQGVPVLGPTEAQLRAAVADHAQAVVQQIADGLSLAAARKAVQLARGRTASELASEVDTYLGGLAHRWERDQLAGAVQQASNGGRFLVFDRVPSEAPVGYYASELLDAATCDRCLEVDGQEYPTLAEAARDYPSGGFHGCRGGPRCRGTVVAVLPESEFDPATSPPGLGPA